MTSRTRPDAVDKPIPVRRSRNRFQSPDIIWDTIAVLILTAIVVAILLASCLMTWVVS